MKNKLSLVSAATGFVSIAERAFLGHSAASGSSLNQGYGRLPVNCSAMLDLTIESQSAGSKYSSVLIVSQSSLRHFLSELLSQELRTEISALTGFSYAIDYFVFNENRHIPIELQGGEHYANFWHTDEMFTANCLKLFIPVEDVGMDNGPMHYLTAMDTRELTKRSFVRAPDLPSEYSSRIMRLTGARGEIAMVKPNVCMHRAGIPASGSVRRQIMLQLNPARKWLVRSNIYSLQSQREINLPFLRKYIARYEDL
jgi:hypothetical protein